MALRQDLLFSQSKGPSEPEIQPPNCASSVPTTQGQDLQHHDPGFGGCRVKVGSPRHRGT